MFRWIGRLFGFEARFKRQEALISHPAADREHWVIRAGGAPCGGSLFVFTKEQLQEASERADKNRAALKGRGW